MDKRKEFEAVKRTKADYFTKECDNCGGDKDLHIHHIIPLALGGTNRLTNLVVLCSDCHSIVHGMSFLKNHGNLVEAGKKQARDQGRWSTGLIPYGYAAGNNSGEIIINESEAIIVQLIYKWKYINKLRQIEIVEALNGMCIETRKERSKWECSTVSQIISRSDIYLGEMHKNVKFPPVLSQEFRELIAEFKDPYYRKKRTYKGKSLEQNRITIGKAPVEELGAFYIVK